MRAMARVAWVSTAVPEHRATQGEALKRAQEIFSGAGALQRYFALYHRCGVETRYLCQPLTAYGRGETFRERNLEYLSSGLRLSEVAVREVLERTGTAASDVGTFLFVTTTGLATPSLDSLLVQRMGLNPQVKRLPLFGIGCAGGSAALARALDLLKAPGEQNVLVLSVELCSQTFVPTDHSPTNLVGTALFGDGVAAALVRRHPVEQGPRIVDSFARLFPGTEQVMGWEFANDGMRLILSKEVPHIVGTVVREAVVEFLGRHGLTPQEVPYHLVHPGGRKVLEAYQRSLEIPAESVRWSKDFLREYGNLSSASVLFILKAVMERGRPNPGDHGLMISVGPGFGVEMVLLRW
jgi:alkylresorcinol/alkylpyrone synthase